MSEHTYRDQVYQMRAWDHARRRDLYATFGDRNVWVIMVLNLKSICYVQDLPTSKAVGSLVRVNHP